MPSFEQGLKTAESRQKATPGKAFTKQFSWELDLPSASIPAKRLTPVFEEMYELKVDSRRGLLGTVTIGTHKPTKIKRIVGKLDRQGRADKDIKADLEALTSLNHPVLLKAESFLYSRKEIRLLSENFTGAKIVSYVEIAGKQSETLVKGLALQLIRFVLYMLSRNSGLKAITLPQLLFYQCSPTEFAFKYTGLAAWKQPTSSSLSIENPLLYSAPEGSAGDPEKSLIWSCGVILHILLTNTVPFHGDSNEQLRESKAAGSNLSVRTWSQFDLKVRGLIGAMLAKDPGNRPTAVECMEHPWLQDYSLPLPPALSAVMTNLRKYQGANSLKQAAQSFIAINTLTPNEKQPFSDIFTYINRSGKGEITQEELTWAFSLVNRAELAAFMAADVFKAVDINQSGFMDFSRFLLASMDYQIAVKSKHLKTAFDLLEPDLNGEIALEDLKAALRSQGNEEIWRNETKNGEGRLGFQEFVRVMRAILGERRR